MLKKLLIIDGNNILYRAFFATLYSPTGQLYTEDGTPVNGVYSFAKMLNKSLRDFSPTHLLVVLDKSRKSFRTELDQDYKANRKPAPDELKIQFPILREMLSSMNICYLESDEYEADDLAGSIVNNYTNDFDEICILTTDKDYWQLCSSKVKIIVPKTGISVFEEIDEKALQEKLNLSPKQIIDLKALMGDPSDNIKGVEGVGEKTALKLLWEYGSVENIYHNIDQIKGKLKEKLFKGKEDCDKSKTLATIQTTIPLSYKVEDFLLNINQEQSNIFYKKYNFNSLIKK